MQNKLHILYLDRRHGTVINTSCLWLWVCIHFLRLYLQIFFSSSSRVLSLHCEKNLWTNPSYKTGATNAMLYVTNLSVKTIPLYKTATRLTRYTPRTWPIYIPDIAVIHTGNCSCTQRMLYTSDIAVIHIRLFSSNWHKFYPRLNQVYRKKETNL